MPRRGTSIPARSRAIRCRYLVGCDGGGPRSGARIGATLAGTPVVQRVQSSYIRAPKLLSMLPGKPAWVMFSLNPRRCGNVMAIDGRETWLVHNYLLDDEHDFDSVDRDWAIRTILGVGADFEYEVLGKEDWIGRRLVADKFRRTARVHLRRRGAPVGAVRGLRHERRHRRCGEPRLAARRAPQGLGRSKAMLDAYEAERLPITEQVSHFAMNHSHSMARQRQTVPDEIEATGTRRRRGARRARQGRLRAQRAAVLLRRSELRLLLRGVADHRLRRRGAAAATRCTTSRPSTVPGCRTPHVWLADGRSLYDAMGPDYTLLRLRSRRRRRRAASAARKERGVPLDVLDVDIRRSRRACIGHKLVLSRPDQHVAWRGDAIPSDPHSTASIASRECTRSRTSKIPAGDLP